MPETINITDVKQFLRQYSRAKAGLRRMEDRRRVLLNDLRNPAPKSIGFNPSGGKPTGEMPEGAGAPLYRVEEIETKIKEQLLTMAQLQVDILNATTALPVLSPEKEIVELRYLELRSWTKIELSMNLSRTSCFRIHDTALERLCEDKTVCYNINKWKEERCI